MVDVAELSLVADSRSVDKGKRSLDGLSTSARRTETATQRMNRENERAAKQFLTTERAIKAAGTALVAYGGIRVFNAALRDLRQFETGLVGVAKTTGLADKELRKYSQEMIKLSQRIPVSTGELLSLSQAAGQMGVTGSANLQKFSETVAKLGRASDLAGEQAATALARIINVSGESISQVDILASVIVSLGNNVAATESEIAAITTRVSQATSAFKISSAESAALGAAMASVGVQAEAGGTAIGQAFSGINNAVAAGGPALEEFAAALGLNGDMLAQLYRDDKIAGFQYFLEQVGQLGDGAGLALENAGLGGIRLAQAIIPLSNNTEIFAKTLGLANAEVENATALNVEAEATYETLDSKIKLLGNNLTALALAFGGSGDNSTLAGAVDIASNAILFMTENIELLEAAGIGVATFYGGKFAASIALSSASFVKASAVTAAHGKALAENALHTMNQSRATAAAAASETAYLRVVQASLASQVQQAAGTARQAVLRQQLAANSVALTAAINAQTSAEIRAAAATNAHAMATSKLVATKTAFRGALTLLGGPLGAAAIGVGALALAYIKLKDRVDEARESMFALHTAGIRSTELRMAELAKEILVASKQLKAFENMAHAGAKRVQEKRDRVDELVAEMERYAESLKLQRAAQKEANTAADEAVVAMDAHVDAMISASEANRKTKESVDAHIVALEQQLTALGMTERAAVIYMATMDAISRDSLPDQIAKTVEVTARIYDQEKALQDAEQAQEASAKTIDSTTIAMDGLTSRLDIQRNMVENLQREWANLINTLGSADFGDFFDVIAKGGMRAVSEAGSADLLSTVLGIGGGGNLAALASGAGGFAQGLFGIGQGASSFMGPMTQSASMGASMGAFLTSPAGIAAMAAIAGKVIHDATNDPDGRHRGVAGFLSGNTPGAPSSSQFGVDAFASGFAPTGFADGPVSREQANTLIDIFRNLDKSIVDAWLELGGNVRNPGSLNGFGLDGTGNGTLFGRSDITTDDQFIQQLFSYASQLINKFDGLDAELMNTVRSAGSVEQIMTILNDAIAEHKKSLEGQEKATTDAARATQQLTDSKIQELDAYIQSNLSMIDLIDSATSPEAQNEVQRILSLRQDLIDSYSEEVRAAEQVHQAAVRNYEEQLRLADNIGRGLAGIMTGSDSALSTQQKLDFAKQDFFDLSQRAVNGDNNAASQLTQSGSTVIALAREMYASSSQFKEIFDVVTGRLESVQGALGSAQNPGTFVPPGDAQMIEQLNQLDSQLQDIKDAIRVDSVNAFLKMNLTLSQLPAQLASVIRSMVGGGSVPSGDGGNAIPGFNPMTSVNESLAGSDIAAFAQGQFDAVGALTENDPGFMTAAENILIAAANNKVGAQQLADSWNAANPGANASADEIAALGRELNIPGFKDGGWSDGPASGYLTMHHGKEITVPENDFNSLKDSFREGISVLDDRLARIERFYMLGKHESMKQQDKANSTLEKISNSVDDSGVGGKKYNDRNAA